MATWDVSLVEEKAVLTMFIYLFFASLFRVLGGDRKEQNVVRGAIAVLDDDFPAPIFYVCYGGHRVTTV